MEAYRLRSPLRPVAPLQALRASSRTIVADGSCWIKCQAMAAPVMPDPMMTYEADVGSEDVVRCSAISEGGICQYDSVGFADGRSAGIGRSMMKR